MVTGLYKVVKTWLLGCMMWEEYGDLMVLEMVWTTKTLLKHVNEGFLSWKKIHFQDRSTSYSVFNVTFFILSHERKSTMKNLTDCL